MAASLTDDEGVLGGVRRLAQQAHERVDEPAILRDLTGLLADLPGVEAVNVLDAEDGQPAALTGPPRNGTRELLPLYADGALLATLVVDGERLLHARWGPQVEALTAAASASLTARRAVRTARLDVLTQVLSRTAMDELLPEELARARRTGQPVSVVFIDLDRFKSINDDLGHAAGDAVLREVAAALRTTSRPYDHVARFGGDEFVVLAPATDADAAALLAERLRQAVTARSSALVGRHVGCSAGVCMGGADLTATDLLDRADAALRAAKRGGRDRVAQDATQMDAAEDPPGVRDQTPDGTPGHDLRMALRGEGIQTVFQPLVDLRTGATVGYEALSRGPGRLESAGRLLDAAADAGRLVELDDGLRHASFAAATAAGLNAPATLFVNLERATLLQMPIDRTLWPRGDAPFPSIAEVTERALFTHPGRLLRATERLRELDWGLAFDDVGQDTRTLALLPLLDPDVVKLDLRLLQDRPPGDLAMVTVAVTAHAQRSGAVVVAEGIEQEQQLDRARALGATVGQGYLCGRPADALGPDGRSHAALPVRRRAAVADTVTPTERLLGDGQHLVGETALLTELQASLERRALGMGGLATLVTAIPEDAHDDRAGGRLLHLARDIGHTVLLHPAAEPQTERGFVAQQLAPDDALAGEWVTVVTCPHYALTLAARPSHGRWAFRLDHDFDRGVAAARSILLGLDARA